MIFYNINIIIWKHIDILWEKDQKRKDKEDLKGKEEWGKIGQNKLDSNTISNIR